MLSSKLTISSALLDVKDDVRLTRLYLAQAWNKLRKVKKVNVCSIYLKYVCQNSTTTLSFVISLTFVSIQINSIFFLSFFHRFFFFRNNDYERVTLIRNIPYRIRIIRGEDRDWERERLFCFNLILEGYKIRQENLLKSVSNRCKKSGRPETWLSDTKRPLRGERKRWAPPAVEKRFANYSIFIAALTIEQINRRQTRADYNAFPRLRSMGSSNFQSS